MSSILTIKGYVMKQVMIMIGMVVLLVISSFPAFAQTGDIVDVASSDERFTTLVEAITAAGITETLQGEGPYTVFAPTNEAFAALPEGTLETLLSDKPRLAKVLLNHVVSGRVSVISTKARSIQGSDIIIAANDENATINDVQIITTDIEASNGIIHVIDAVLIPPDDGPTQLMPVTGNFAQSSDILLTWIGLTFLGLLVGFGIRFGYLRLKA